MSCNKSPAGRLSGLLSKRAHSLHGMRGRAVRSQLRLLLLVELALSLEEPAKSSTDIFRLKYKGYRDQTGVVKQHMHRLLGCLQCKPLPKFRI